eukprot:882321-Amphidinium_carterae.1
MKRAAVHYSRAVIRCTSIAQFLSDSTTTCVARSIKMFSDAGSEDPNCRRQSIRAAQYVERFCCCIVEAVCKDLRDTACLA